MQESFVVLIQFCCIGSLLLYWFSFVVLVQFCCIDSVLLYWFSFVVLVQFCLLAKSLNFVSNQFVELKMTKKF